MISITDVAGRRIYTVPRGLAAAAQRVFPGKTESEAIYQLARCVTADRFASLAAIAENDVDQAAARALEWLFLGQIWDNRHQKARQKTGKHNKISH
jgi:hypothetical protein